MRKFIDMGMGEFAIIEQGSAEDLAIDLIPTRGRPERLDESHPAVVTYLTAIAEAAKPKEVTMRQARLALLQGGLLDQVTAAVVALPGDAGKAAQVEWEYSNSLKRTQPLVTQLAAVVGLTSAQVDNLFAVAATL